MAVELLTVFYIVSKNSKKQTIPINILFIEGVCSGLTVYLEFIEFGIGEKRFSSIKFTFKI
jgi:hypothetical protein